MKIDEFSDLEIEEINNITSSLSINEKKSHIQTLIVNRSLANSNKNIILWLFTGFGKTTTALLYTDRYKKKYKENVIKIVVPTSNLKRDWYKKRDYYDVSVINSFTMRMNDNEKMCNFLIVDEVHHALGQESKYFSTALDIDTDYKIGLTASLTDKNITKLIEKGFSYIFKLSVDTGLKLGIVPEAVIINVPIVLSPTEKLLYHTNEQELLINSKIFSTVLFYSHENKDYLLRRLCVNILKPVKETFKFNGLDYNSSMLIIDIFNKLQSNNIMIKDKAIILGMAKKVNYNFIKRDSTVENAKDKIQAVFDILKIVEKKKGELKNILIFSKSISFLEILNNNLIRKNINCAFVHSKLSTDKINKTLIAFKEEYFKILLSIGMIKEGFDIEKCDTVIRTAYNATILDAEQIIGRTLRFDINNPDKKSVVFNLYVDTFTYREVTYESIEANKLENAYKNYDMTWVDNIDKINEEKEE